MCGCWCGEVGVGVVKCVCGEVGVGVWVLVWVDGCGCGQGLTKIKHQSIFQVVVHRFMHSHSATDCVCACVEE